MNLFKGIIVLLVALSAGDLYSQIQRNSYDKTARTPIETFTYADEFLNFNKHITSEQQSQKKIIYETKIDAEMGDVLKLTNGAIVEITFGYLGYLGYRKNAVLFRDGLMWKIWIEDKKVFTCTLLKSPDRLTKDTYEKAYINEVKGDGAFLLMSDGSIYETSDTFDTMLWLGYNDALIINGNRLLNLDEGGNIIYVIKIK